MKRIIAKRFLVATALIGTLCPLTIADSLKNLSQKLREGMDGKAKPTLAVLNFVYSNGRVSTGSDLVSERLVTYLAQAGIPVIERRLLEKLLEERLFSETGFVDERRLSKDSSMAGVDAVVIGTLNDISDEETEVMARVVKLNTGEILSAGSTVIAREWHDLPHPPQRNYARLPIPDAGSWVLRSESTTQGRPPRQRLDPKKREPYRMAPVPFLMPTTSLGGSFE